MKSGKPVIRQTLSQERFNVLRKKQLAGTASFKDLTELDEIVNRDPQIRISILEEMEEESNPTNNFNSPGLTARQPAAKLGLSEKVKQLIDRIFRFTPHLANVFN